MKQTILICLVLVNFGLKAQKDSTHNFRNFRKPSKNSFISVNLGLKQTTHSEIQSTEEFTFYNGTTPYLELNYGKNIGDRIVIETGLWLTSISNSITRIGSEDISNAGSSIKQEVYFMQVPLNIVRVFNPVKSRFSFGGFAGGGVLIYVTNTPGVFSSNRYLPDISNLTFGSIYRDGSSTSDRFSYYLDIGFISEYKIGENSLQFKIRYQFNFKDQFNTFMEYYMNRSRNEASIEKRINGLMISVGYKFSLGKKG
jgi:hypothetical protein